MPGLGSLIGTWGPLDTLDRFPTLEILEPWDTLVPSFDLESLLNSGFIGTQALPEVSPHASPHASPQVCFQATPSNTKAQEDVFTDSGYASVLPARCSSPCARAEESDIDNKTVISAATAIGIEAQRPLAEVCNDIYNQIQPHVDDDNRDLVLGALPNLIKAFAIRLAHCDPSSTSRQIMHFIYSRHL